MNRKVKSFKQCFYRNSVQCRKLQVQSLGLDTGPQLFCYSFFALSMIRCSKSAQKFAVWVGRVATVVTEATQLVLSQFKKILFTVFN